MYVKDIAKIKKQIISGRKDKDIQEEWNISDGQIGFIHDVLLKGSHRSVERRVTKLEQKKSIAKGSFIFCNEADFGLGEVIQIFNCGDLMTVKFQNRPLKTMCSLKNMTTVHDATKRKLKPFFVS